MPQGSTTIRIVKSFSKWFPDGQIRGSINYMNANDDVISRTNELVPFAFLAASNSADDSNS